MSWAFGTWMGDVDADDVWFVQFFNGLLAHVVFLFAFVPFQGALLR
jgi:hypothetical protein